MRSKDMMTAVLNMIEVYDAKNPVKILGFRVSNNFMRGFVAVLGTGLATLLRLVVLR